MRTLTATASRRGSRSPSQVRSDRAIDVPDAAHEGFLDAGRILDREPEIHVVELPAASVRRGNRQVHDIALRRLVARGPVGCGIFMR